MRNGFFSEFDACFAIGLDNVASDVWIALASLDDQTVVATGSYGVLPDLGRAKLCPVSPCNFYTVLV